MITFATLVVAILSEQKK
ncbi:hypothetical protein [Gracilibacillus salinarum]